MTRKRRCAILLKIIPYLGLAGLQKLFRDPTTHQAVRDRSDHSWRPATPAAEVSGKPGPDLHL